MTSLDLESLEKKALAATPGPWINSGRIFYAIQDSKGNNLISTVVENAENNDVYIAAVSPDVVLDLIARVEGMEEALKKILSPEKDIGLGCFHEVYAKDALEKWGTK